ncbi:helicase associated domain-containing protein [Streptomyces sp. NPDC057460]|uniref:helicase associated domain-containing protein n=1 Tax=Streptomyces sp. NPDC057460 TaxID=3346141 RepID=UPI0036946B69
MRKARSTALASSSTALQTASRGFDLRCGQSPGWDRAGRAAASSERIDLRGTRSGSKTGAGKGAARGTEAFQRGVAALQQYVAREGRHVVGRGHVEELPDGTTVRLGVFLSNQKARRDKLNADQRRTLTELGLEWAVA